MRTGLPRAHGGSRTRRVSLVPKALARKRDHLSMVAGRNQRPGLALDPRVPLERPVEEHHNARVGGGQGAGQTSGGARAAMVARVPRRLLVIVHPYPPVPSVGSNRWGAMVKYLRRSGHEVCVVTTGAFGRLPPDEKKGADASRTTDLMALPWLVCVGLGPLAQPGAPATTVPPVPGLLTKTIVPDAFLVSWMPFAHRAARRAVRARDFDCVITSAPSESTHFIGLALHRRGIPWVADFRDGWIFEPYRPEMPTAPQRALDRSLERALVRRADAVMAATKPIADDFEHRLGVPALHVPNGWDPDLEPGPNAAGDGAHGALTLVHTGKLTGLRGRDPGVLFAGIRRAVDNDAELRGRLRVVLAGPQDSRDAEAIERAGLGEIVHYRGNLTRPDALALSARPTGSSCSPRATCARRPENSSSIWPRAVRSSPWRPATRRRGSSRRRTPASRSTPTTSTRSPAPWRRSRAESSASGTRRGISSATSIPHPRTRPPRRWSSRSTSTGPLERPPRPPRAPPSGRRRRHLRQPARAAQRLRARPGLSEPTRPGSGGIAIARRRMAAGGARCAQSRPRARPRRHRHAARAARPARPTLDLDDARAAHAAAERRPTAHSRQGGPAARDPVLGDNGLHIGRGARGAPRAGAGPAGGRPRRRGACRNPVHVAGPDAREAVRAELGIDEAATLCVFAGTLEPRKAPLLAARAAIDAHRPETPVVLLVVGDGPLRGEVEALAGDVVRPLGFRDDVNRLMAASDVFVLPSTREGLPLALLEAMSHGLVPIVADEPGSLEAVGEAGIAVPAGDLTALASAIAELARNRGERDRLAGAARERYEERFRLERFLAAMDSVYRRALE